MAVRVIEAPATPLMVLDDAKAYLNLGHDDDDGLINEILNAAIAEVDGPSSIGRAIAPQTLEFSLAKFPRRGVPIPAPRLISIVSVVYQTADGSPVTLAPSAYRFSDGALADGEILPELAWPCDVLPGSIRIRYTAGYSETDAEYRIARQIVRALVVFWYENRDAQGVVPEGVEMMRRRLRVVRF